jgi:hypothetical protein
MSDEMNQHLTSDELVDKLYGVGTGDHLDGCQECSQRFLELRERREMAVEPQPASYEFLAAQRRNIYARMGDQPQVRMKWVPALAAVLCLAASVVFVHRPADQAAKPEVVDSQSDTQLFSDVYSMEQSMEPLAAKPIHELFDQDR